MPELDRPGGVAWPMEWENLLPFCDSSLSGLNIDKQPANPTE